MRNYLCLCRERVAIIMPSLWPFARDDSSPASFEKALSKLSTQITSSTISLDKSRTRAHRSKGVWTLWATLAYLVYTTILVLVLGPQQWSLPHYAGLLATPVAVYGVRRLLALIFDWQIARQQGQLDRLVKEREQKIAQLKKATKYDSTQELLNKYGGSSTRAQPGEKQGTKRKANTPNSMGQQQQRINFTPPPTANIPGRSPAAQQSGSRPSTPAKEGSSASTPPSLGRNARSPLSGSVQYNSPSDDVYTDEPGFAPNAFPAPPPSLVHASDQQHRWYDRILDVMLGEDETLAKNRLALLCANCRLVNGQAPPGIRTFGEIGRWRCGSCGAWNGVEKVEHDVGQIVQEMKMKEEREGGDGGWTKVSRGDEELPDSPELMDKKHLEVDEGGDEEEVSAPTDKRSSKDSARELSDLNVGGETESKVGGKKANESVGERVARRRVQK